MLFDWLVTGQSVPVNPASSVRGPRYSIAKGLTPVLSSDEARELLRGLDVSHVIGLRDLVGAVVQMQVEDYYPQKRRWWVWLREKNGKLNEMPCHHNLEAWLDEYIEPAKIADQKKAPLFRSTRGRTRQLTKEAMTRFDVYRMIRRRVADVGLETAAGGHTFRATGITDCLTNAGKLEVAQRMAGRTQTQRHPGYTIAAAMRFRSTKWSGSGSEIPHKGLIRLSNA
jgi:integrase/recombinase XerD